MRLQLQIENHPCFNEKAKGCMGRVHLPVAPECNIKCNYCNRKYDCVNESRPGVTSSILSPEQAVMYLRKVLERNSSIAVAGIAGPGDTFANPERTMRTLSLIRESFPDILLCVSTNGLNLLFCVDELARLQV
ncbi:MAG: radical SAM protein, partial [Syntrophaceae bacterium]|nr:radical SAM protein [Syntrophaceae bacterium]